VLHEDGVCDTFVDGERGRMAERELMWTKNRSVVRIMSKQASRTARIGTVLRTHFIPTLW
jgi:hypothetical protein